MKSMQILIVGASGFLGKKLHKTITAINKFNVVGTKFSSSDDNNLLYFDITKDSIKDIIDYNSSEKKYAVICSSLSSISLVENNKDVAYDFNVTNTKRLIDELIEMDFSIIFLSSSSVYSGKSDFDTEDAEPLASILYGKTKIEVEQYIKDKCKKYIILRPGKIIDYEDNNKNLITEYYNLIKSHKPFNCIENCTLSIVAVSDVINIIILLINNEITGTFNLSSGECLERKDLAIKFSHIFKMQAEINIYPLEWFHMPEGYPLRNSISNKKIVNELGYEFLTYEEILKKYKSYKEKNEEYIKLAY